MTFTKWMHKKRDTFFRKPRTKKREKKPQKVKGCYKCTSPASYSTKPCVDPKTSVAWHNWAKNFIKFHLIFLTISFIIWMSHRRHKLVVGAEFWISCHRLRLLRKVCCLQLIQHSEPFTILWCQFISWKITVWHSPYISIVLYRVTLVQDPVLALHARTTSAARARMLKPGLALSLLCKGLY